MSFRSGSNISLSIKTTKATHESFSFVYFVKGVMKLKKIMKLWRLELKGAPACFQHAISWWSLQGRQHFNMAVPWPVNSLNHSLLQILSLAVLTSNRNFNMRLTLLINQRFNLSFLCCKLLHASCRWHGNFHKDLDTYQGGSFGIPPTLFAVAVMVPRSWEKGSFSGWHYAGC